MTRITSDWLEQFPVREQCLYLDHAAVCPLPAPVALAMRQRIDDQMNTGHTRDDRWINSNLACRHVGAQLVGCAPEDITLIKSTSEGLSLIAEGIEWSDGDEVLLGEQEFAANVAPWLNLKTRGVRVRRFGQQNGVVDVDAVRDCITSRTRLLAVSWISFFSGWIAPLKALSDLCRNHDILLIVDAIQGLGVVPISMQDVHVDAVVADSHKWLLGPEGVGLMATSETLRKSIRPVLTGWRNIQRRKGSMFLDSLSLLQDGRRFEAGARNVVGLAGLAAALDLLTSTGVNDIHQIVENLNRSVTRLLLARGWNVISPGSGHPVAGIVAACPPDQSASEIQKRLRERHVICSVREGHVRFSPHFYVTPGEIDALGKILDKCCV